MRWKGLVGLSVPVWSLLLCLLMPVAVEAATPVRVSVVRSTGTQFLGQTIWRELNAGWSTFGNVPVEINYTALAGHNLTLAQIQATQADVLVLSNPAFLTYTTAEIYAIRQYVESGHGLIISYSTFYHNDRFLAPLVGLNEGIDLGTVTVSDSIQFDLLHVDHPLFVNLQNPYITGVPFRARPPLGESWPLNGGTVLADLFTDVILPAPGIIGHDVETYRGLYFSHYPEDMSGGTNQQDMQLFYNGLLWTAGVPEPTSGLLALVAAAGWGIVGRRGTG